MKENPSQVLSGKGTCVASWTSANNTSQALSAKAIGGRKKGRKEGRKAKRKRIDSKEVVD